MEKVFAVKAVELAQTQGVGGAGSMSGMGADPSSRSGFDAAMRAAERRSDQSYDVVPQQSAPFATPDIGSGLQNVAKTFSDYRNDQMGPDLKRIINADPLDPNFTIDVAAYGIKGTIANLHFTVAAKMTGQMSKNLDTLFKSS